MASNRSASAANKNVMSDVAGDVVKGILGGKQFRRAAFDLQ